MTKSQDQYSLSFKIRIINFFNNNLDKILIIVVILGLFLNLFLWLLLPAFSLPIDKIEKSYYDYNIRYDSYFIQEIKINKPVILPYSDFFLNYRADRTIDVYILNSKNYVKFLEIKTQGGNLDDLNYIAHHDNRLYGSFSLEFEFIDLFNEPMYIVIDPNNNSVDIDISYKLNTIERFWYLLSFIIIIILFCLLLIFRSIINKNNPWNFFHDIIYNSAYKLFKKGFFDKAISAVDNEIEQILKIVNKKKKLKKNFGVNLIEQLFSENEPIIFLEDISTEEGKENQRDYKIYFKNCFRRIRNPFAHLNFKLQKQEAIRKIHLLDEMLNALEKGYILNEQGEKKSIFEYINKQLVNHKIDSKLKVIEIQELSDKKIENIIIKYLKKNKGKEIYPSDIAIEYNLDAKRVFDICQNLKKEGKLI